MVSPSNSDDDRLTLSGRLLQCQDIKKGFVMSKYERFCPTQLFQGKEGVEVILKGLNRQGKVMRGEKQALPSHRVRESQYYFKC